MSRSSIRIFAFIVVALLGAPLAMHVVMHDLHDHHDEYPVAYAGTSGHGDHEHPVVSSAAPQVPSLARADVPLIATGRATPVTWSSTARMERNVIAHGALRADEDVGLQQLLSTFLI